MHNTHYDHLGSGFTLLRFQEGADAAPFIQAASERGVPLKVVDLQAENAEDRYGAALVLVRPDQHIAWRGANGAGAADILDQVCSVLHPTEKT